MFSEKLISAIEEKNSYLCLGLDPDVKRMPKDLIHKYKDLYDSEVTSICHAIYEFNCALIDACLDYIVCVKPQMAYYELWGHEGYHVLQKTVEYANSKGLLSIVDAKRNDISSTAKAYADAILEGQIKADATTVNLYLGEEGVKPFLEHKTKGIFLLLKTSNPGSKELQSLPIRKGLFKSEPLYLHLAKLIKTWDKAELKEEDYSNLGVVVGATFPEEAKILRKLLPKNLFLVPGLGTQGGKLNFISNFFNKDNQGAIISLSRDINYAFERTGGDFQKAAQVRAQKLRDKINISLGI